MMIFCIFTFWSSGDNAPSVLYLRYLKMYNCTLCKKSFLFYYQRQEQCDKRWILCKTCKDFENTEEKNGTISASWYFLSTFILSRRWIFFYLYSPVNTSKNLKCHLLWKYNCLLFLSIISIIINDYVFWCSSCPSPCVIQLLNNLQQDRWRKMFCPWNKKFSQNLVSFFLVFGSCRLYQHPKNNERHEL